MTNQWTELTDEKLAEIAQRGLQEQGAPVEAMRRLRVALEQSSKRSDAYARWMLCLTIILALLTVVQAIPAIEIIKGWLSP